MIYDGVLVLFSTSEVCICQNIPNLTFYKQKTTIKQTEMELAIIDDDFISTGAILGKT